MVGSRIVAAGEPRSDEAGNGEVANGGGTLAESALSRILDLFQSGELKPGAFVNEADLAKKFHMSRGPVREAVRRLEGRKLVIREAYQRARFIDLGIQQIREIFELRECLEGMACRLATRHMSDEAMAELGRQVERPASMPKFTTNFTNEFRFDFHTQIASACNNGRILETLRSEVYDLVRLYRWSSGAVPGREGAARREHWEIFRAMKSRDEDLAESLMRAHIQRATQLVGG
jgi:DNA-binding GntR family transcriptional regulator